MFSKVPLGSPVGREEVELPWKIMMMLVMMIVTKLMMTMMTKKGGDCHRGEKKPNSLGGGLVRLTSATSYRHDHHDGHHYDHHGHDHDHDHHNHDHG